MLTVILAVLIGLLAYVLIRFAALAQSSGDEWTPARPIANTDVNPYGANFFLAREVEPWKRERTAEMAEQAGLGWAKQQFSWAEIEPLRKGEFIDPVRTMAISSMPLLNTFRGESSISRFGTSRISIPSGASRP
jgi:hypothetical protein